jgi:hypothetical protein
MNSIQGAGVPAPAIICGDRAPSLQVQHNLFFTFLFEGHIRYFLNKFGQNGEFGPEEQ